MARQFRTNASYRAEIATRDLLKPFLESLGWTAIVDTRKSYGRSQSQKISAVSPAGIPHCFGVRLCWRQSGDRKQKRSFSASQLLARVDDGKTAEDAIAEKLERQRQDGATHLLFVQPRGRKIVYAASVPLASALDIWRRQRDESGRLISSGATGRRKKNLAMNGRSPTIWLQSDRDPTVAEELWRTPGVIDLARTETTAIAAEVPVDDTFDDLSQFALGGDGQDRSDVIRSEVRRDRRVRQAVATRSGGRCERPGCAAKQSFPGFIDVHHVLGAEKSDRVYNCVALCPNCHREAHFSPEKDALNRELLAVARRLSVPRRSTATGVQRER